MTDLINYMYRGTLFFILHIYERVKIQLGDLKMRNQIITPPVQDCGD